MDSQQMEDILEFLKHYNLYPLQPWWYNTVNLEIFARILFSQIALKDIFATLEICDLGMI